MDTQDRKNTPPTGTCGRHHPISRHAGALRVLSFVLAGGIASFVGQAYAHEGGPGGFFGGPMGDAVDPARVEARIDRMTRHLAVEADATPQQQEKLAAIAKAAAKDLAELRTRMREHRQQAMATLAAPEVDRARLETLRAEQMKDADALSRRMTQALADAAEVLSPEQRKKLAEHVAERRRHGPRHGPWGGGSHG